MLFYVVVVDVWFPSTVADFSITKKVSQISTENCFAELQLPKPQHDLYITKYEDKRRFFFFWLLKFQQDEKG